MVFGIYDPPDGSPLQAWSDLKIGDICDAVEFDYTKYFCGAGTFTLVIPRNSAYVDKIYIGCFLLSKAENINAEEYNGFIVKNIVYENDTLKITGYDLNGLLLDRITLYPQEYADMAVKVGSTEEIVKYYVDYNCVSSTDIGRNFPALGIAENKNRGIANDAASPRLECVADVIADILGAQNMGYRIYPFLDRGGGAILEFDVFEAVDRTQNQNINSRDTFSFGLGNVAQMKREVGVTADKNTFYCELSSGAVQRYYKKPPEEETPPEETDGAVPDETGGTVPEQTAANEKRGYDRREEYLKLSCELAEIEVYAEHEIADRYRLTNSLEITAGNPLDYGSVYNVGDIVTVYDRERKLQLDSIISASEIKRTGTEYTVKITLGDSKPKVLDSYAKKGQATANSARTTFGVGRPSEWDNTSEYFNRYSPKGGNIAGIEGKRDQYAHAEGYAVKALGFSVHAEGFQNSIEGSGCHVEGYSNKSAGKNNYAIHIEGQGNTLNGSNVTAAHIEGYSNTYNGKGNASYIHIEGSGNNAGGYNAHVQGQGNTIEYGDYSHAGGFQNTLKSSASAFVNGQFNNMTGSDYSHVSGYSNTINNSQSSTAEGQSNTVEGGTANHAEGASNKITNASQSHAEGMSNTITGGSGNSASGMSNTVENASFSRAGGMSSKILGGVGCFTHGVNLVINPASAPTAAAFGQYNDHSDGLIFMIGNGTGDDKRSNAFAVDSAGNIYITGDIYINGVKLNFGGAGNDQNGNA